MVMDAKKRAALIAAVPEEDKEVPEKEETETPTDRLELAKDVLAALKSGDAKALDAALYDYLEACNS
jgi:hypothetical protein